MGKCKCGLVRTKENKSDFVRDSKKRGGVVLCRECYKDYRKNYNYNIIKSYRDENREEYNESQNKYYQNNKSKHNEYVKKYKKKKRKEDPIFKFKENVRGVIGRGFRDKGFIKESRSYKILGCTYDEFKIYIESKFEDWMTWENYGVDKRTKIKPKMTWDIDHIIPISTATTKEDVIKLNHYTNLQPLCSYYNRYVKGG
jgi:hypothetical protein